MIKIVLATLSCLMLSACSSDPYQGLYEGIKQQNESRRTPQEKAMTPAPSYDNYKNEREKIAP
ncbi:MAG: hypothetical protein Q8O24_07650 [Gallionellaceae bacterium]|nr:hypothetical protein [Gallionellaceae bacterium]